MKIISNRFSLIFYAALFNILFEYSARGIYEFLHKPLLILALFGIYFTWFTMLEDLMVRFKLSNKQTVLTAFLYGLFPTAFFTGNLFNPSVYWGITLAGVNLGALIIIGIFAWGILQGIVTLYFANRLCARDWNHPKMGKFGWVVAIIYQLLMIVVAQKNPRVPRGLPISYLFLGLLIIIAAALFIGSLKRYKPEIYPFKPSPLMDFLAFGSVALFLTLGTFFIHGPRVITSQPLNQMAVVIESLWTVLVGFIFFFYRYRKRLEVMV